MATIPTFKDASFIILTGGQSKRMGMDKGSLAVSETTFFKQVLKMAQTITNHVFVSVGNHNQEYYQNTEAMVISDKVSNKGPMGGIVTVLPQITNNWFFVVSVDTPMVTTEMFLELWKNKDEHDAVVFSSEDRIHPLIGLYNSNTKSGWYDAFLADKLKITSLVKSFNINVIETHREQEKRLKNINTPQEYHELIESF
jgi:molybdopterin-guanine dinucleotide biosynthesis protein A